MSITTTVAEHLAFCKQRALEYIERNDLKGAFGSMLSDMQKHPGTTGHPALRLGMMLMVSNNLNTQKKMRDFIEGFN